MAAPTATRVLGFAGAESGLIDVGSIDGETQDTVAAIGAAVSIEAGALIGKGAWRYLCDFDVTNNDSHINVIGLAIASGASNYRVTMYCSLWLDTGPGKTAQDVPLMRGSAANWEVRAENSTDGKMHLFDNGAAEIDAAHAWTFPFGTGATPTFGAVFGMRMTYGVGGAGPWPIKLEYNLLAGGGWVTGQSGTTATALGLTTTSLKISGSANKVTLGNYQMRVDNAVIEDDSTAAFDDTLIDVVVNGVPASDAGTFNTYQNSAGTACSVAGANCWTAVDEAPPPNTTDYVKATSNFDKQTWPVTNAFLHSYDVPLSAIIALHQTIASGSASNAPHVIYAGTDYETSSNAPGALTVWEGGPNRIEVAVGAPLTAANLIGCEIGARVSPITQPYEMRINAIYLIVAYKAGVPGPVPYTVRRPRRVVQPAFIPRSQRSNIALLSSTPVTPPATPQRRRWVQVS